MRIGGLLQMQSKRDVAGNLVGREHRDVGDVVGRGVGRAQIARPAVDVDGPHRGVRGAAGHGDRDGAGAAAEVEQVAGCGGAGALSSSSLLPASICA